MQVNNKEVKKISAYVTAKTGWQKTDIFTFNAVTEVDLKMNLQF